MNDIKKRYFFIFFGIVALSVLGPLGLYIYNFWGSSLSGNPDDWASFGDYLGGTVNTLFSILNFAAVIGLAFIIYWLETKRDFDIQSMSLSMSLKPFIEVYNELKQGELSIKLKNNGNGPAKINHVDIAKGSNKNIELLKLLQSGENNDVVIGGVTVEPGTYLGAGDEVVLLLISGNPGMNEEFNFYIKQALEALSEAEIVVSYSDIFHQKMEDKKCSLEPLRQWSGDGF